MKRASYILLLLTCLLFLPACLVAQTSRLTLDTARRCVIPGPHIIDRLYRLDSSAMVVQMVGEILSKVKRPPNFELSAVSTNVPGAAAVVADGKQYLLYYEDYFNELRSSKHLAYGLLAHEISHLVLGHVLDGKNRLREESEADRFTGAALQALGFPLDASLAVADLPAYGYALGVEERKKCIEQGWHKSDLYLQSQKSAGFLGNKDVLVSLPLPEFKLPAADCAIIKELAPAYRTRPRNLGEVNNFLCEALQKKGYDQRSYYYLPDGFALVTQLEQCNQNGIPLPGADRWKDYAVPEKITGTWEYLKSLVLPQTSRFRLFVFVVYDKALTSAPDRKLTDTKQAEAWLAQGGSSLPPDMEKWPLKPAHKVTMFVYELTQNSSTRNVTAKCRADTAEHYLRTSGLLQWLPPKR